MTPQAPKWMSQVLLLAALYNILWGAWTVFFPDSWFDLTAATRPNYPQLWQCIGMIVGVYGIGYAAASLNPFRYWPVVLVGLLGKIFGPMGFVWALAGGVFPPAFGLTILTNDLIWWLPFGLILLATYRQFMSETILPDSPEQLAKRLQHVQVALPDGQQRILAHLSENTPVLMLFLRHAGCIFCKEALFDLSQSLSRLNAAGIETVVIMMSDMPRMQQLMADYPLAGVFALSDPERHVYKAFGLGRGGVGQLFSWTVIKRGLAAALHGHQQGMLEGDGFQMPGAVLLKNSQLVSQWVFQNAAEVLDVEAVLKAAS
ncbi:MAG: peroxiredoxin-like family protein [Vampirovibrionales bacterium]|nr:peroxiredoxin-like family protein [Vampirovibrionales bacterium]